MLQYVIQPCDTVFSVAQKFGLNYEQILRSNPNIKNRTIFPGQSIHVPISTYRVLKDDTLNKISHKFNMPLDLLLSLNPRIVHDGNISVGQSIFISNVQPSDEIHRQLTELESNINSVMTDINNKNWDVADRKAIAIRDDFDSLKPAFSENSVPRSLINIIDDAITDMKNNISTENIHEAKVNAFIISEYYSDILDIMRTERKST